MRTVGRRKERPPGLRWPSREDFERSASLAEGRRLIHKKGVVRYRSHAEANADMMELVADAMVRTSLEMAVRK